MSNNKIKNSNKNHNSKINMKNKKIKFGIQ